MEARSGAHPDGHGHGFGGAGRTAPTSMLRRAPMAMRLSWARTSRRPRREARRRVRAPLARGVGGKAPDAVRHAESVAGRPTPVVRGPWSIVHRPLCVVRGAAHLVRSPPSVVCLPRSARRDLPSALRPPSSDPAFRRLRPAPRDPRLEGSGEVTTTSPLCRSRRRRSVKYSRTMSHVYEETFDRGPGGWWGFAGNHLGLQPLAWRRGVVTTRSPWWIDYNHAPPGAGYLHMLARFGPRTPSQQSAGEFRRLD